MSVEKAEKGEDFMACWLWYGDITKIHADVVANAANTELKRAPGICEAIYAAADSEQLERECAKYPRLRIAHAAVTSGCGLPAKYIIHVAGAGWYRGTGRDRMLLAQCYRAAMNKALLYQCRTIAIPLMFSGDYHIPREEAVRIAGREIEEFVGRHPRLDVILVLYRKQIYNMAKFNLRWKEYEDGKE